MEKTIEINKSNEEESKIAEMEYNQKINSQQLILDKYQELIDEQSKLIARQEEQIELMRNMFINYQNRMEELIMQHTSIINSLINR